MSRKLQPWFICLVTILVAVFAIPFPLLEGTTTASSPPTVTELRGVWLTNVGSAVLFTPWGVPRALKQLQQQHFNTVYPVVWNRGHTFYPSEATKLATGTSQDPWLTVTHLGQDVLADLVERGHQHQLRVIPWFEYGFMAPAHSELTRRHPDWLTRRQDETLMIRPDAAEEGQLLLAGVPRSPLARIQRSMKTWQPGNQVWLNPLHPQVQRFVLSLIAEVLANYDVDGIQLDDHFGFPVEFGYDFYTTYLYRQEHGGANPPSNPFDEEWMRWRANKLTAFMGQIVDLVRRSRPDCIVSLSPNSQAFAYRFYLQDWPTWVDRGWIDELLLQAYRDDLGLFQAELNQAAIQRAKQKIPVGVGILTGTWNRPIAIAQIQQQVEAVRQQGFDGVSFFYWESLWGYLAPESPRQRRAQFQALFSSSATSPSRAS